MIDGKMSLNSIILASIITIIFHFANYFKYMMYILTELTEILLILISEKGQDDNSTFSS